MLFIERDFKIAGRTVYGNRAKIAARLHRFDTGCCASCEKRQHTLPVIGTTKTKMEDVLILRLDRLLSRQPPNLSRRSLVGFADRSIESSHTTETCSQGQLAH